MSTLTIPIQCSSRNICQSNQTREINEGIHVGKKELKLLFKDDLIFYIESPKNSTKKLELITKVSNVARYDIKMQKARAFVDTNNEPNNKEIMITVPVTVTSRKFKEVKVPTKKNYAILKKEIGQCVRK